MIDDDFRRRLLYVLHRGLVETRLLAQQGKMDQVRDLADLLEVIPGWVNDGMDVPSPAEIEVELRRHEQRYPGSFNYSDFIHRHDPPPF